MTSSPLSASVAATTLQRIAVLATCPICRGVLHDPTLIPACQHCFCFTCINRVIEEGFTDFLTLPVDDFFTSTNDEGVQQRAKEDEEDKKAHQGGGSSGKKRKRRSFACPVCGQAASRWMLQRIPALEMFLQRLFAHSNDEAPQTTKGERKKKPAKKSHGAEEDKAATTATTAALSGRYEQWLHSGANRIDRNGAGATALRPPSPPPLKPPAGPPLHDTPLLLDEEEEGDHLSRSQADANRSSSTSSPALMGIPFPLEKREQSLQPSAPAIVAPSPSTKEEEVVRRKDSSSATRRHSSAASSHSAPRGGSHVTEDSPAGGGNSKSNSNTPAAALWTMHSVRLALDESVWCNGPLLQTVLEAARVLGALIVAPLLGPDPLSTAKETTEDGNNTTTSPHAHPPPPHIGATHFVFATDGEGVLPCVSATVCEAFWLASQQQQCPGLFAVRVEWLLDSAQQGRWLPLEEDEEEQAPPRHQYRCCGVFHRPRLFLTCSPSSSSSSPSSTAATTAAGVGPMRWHPSQVGWVLPALPPPPLPSKAFSSTSSQSRLTAHRRLDALRRMLRVIFGWWDPNEGGGATDPLTNNTPRRLDYGDGDLNTDTAAMGGSMIEQVTAASPSVVAGGTPRVNRTAVEIQLRWGSSSSSSTSAEVSSSSHGVVVLRCTVAALCQRVVECLDPSEGSTMACTRLVELLLIQQQPQHRQGETVPIAAALSPLHFACE